MIVDERLVTYINSLDAGNTAMLDQIEREATADYVPIIRKEMQSFLKFLLAMKKPARILEVGTAVGFSAILMAEYDPVPCQITTIENYEKRIPIARENFKRAGKEAQIALLEGDAAEVLKTLEDPYDFIYGRGKRAVHSFPAGDSAPSGEGRRAGVGQCAAGRRCDRITVRGDKAEPHDS